MSDSSVRARVSHHICTSAQNKRQCPITSVPVPKNMSQCPITSEPVQKTSVSVPHHIYKCTKHPYQCTKHVSIPMNTSVSVQKASAIVFHCDIGQGPLVDNQHLSVSHPKKHLKRPPHAKVNAHVGPVCIHKTAIAPHMRYRLRRQSESNNFSTRPPVCLQTGNQ